MELGFAIFKLGSYTLEFYLRRNRRAPGEGADLGYGIVLSTGLMNMLYRYQ
jgi:hypothetical protein